LLLQICKILANRTSNRGFGILTWKNSFPGLFIKRLTSKRLSRFDINIGQYIIPQRESQNDFFVIVNLAITAKGQIGNINTEYTTLCKTLELLMAFPKSKRNRMIQCQSNRL